MGNFHIHDGWLDTTSMIEREILDFRTEGFGSLTGFTTNDFILRLKVEEAARILERDPTRTVTAIAHELGFSSSQYFATVFRRYLRVSPGEYRSGNVAGSCPQAPGGSVRG